MQPLREPIQYRELNDIDHIQGFDADDTACLDEIAAVLQKHGKSNRFGIALLHKHFELAEDEILLERCDKTTRTLTLRPEKISSQDARHAIETIWTCGDAHAQACKRQCVVGKDGTHYGYKEHL